ncbi:MAG: site-2 protease family protein [Oscillospiraceae bacterium]|nr:site-2 protease family protein [Oscillospiraceae bacterium]
MRASGIEIGVDFTFFAVITMFLTLDTTGFALMSLFVCAIHECGHLIAMLIGGHKPNSIFFKGGGIRLSNSGADSVFILIAGSAVNLGLFFALYFTLPKTDIYPVMFAVLNLVIGVFNLLPVGCLDGKRILETFLPNRILRAVEIFFLAAIIFAVSVAIPSGGVNFTFAAAMIYILCVDVFSRV